MEEDKSGGLLNRCVTGTTFLYLNLGLFALMCNYVYWDWFSSVKPRANILEFFVYATLILCAIALVRKMLKGLRVPVWLLILAETGLLMNFVGGLGMVDGKRVFDTVWLGLRYDKYVHFFNSFAGALFLARYRWPFETRSKIAGPVMAVVAVMGLGAIVEVVEYAIVCNVPGNGVGTYDNNMQDMIWNGLGAIAGVVLVRVRQAAPAREASAERTAEPCGAVDD